MRIRPQYRHPSDGGLSQRSGLLLGMVLLLPATLGAIVALTGGLPVDPTAFVGPPNAPPSWARWLGTDALGRDLCSRLAAAAAQFAIPALLALGAALALGGAIGLAEGLGGTVIRRAASWFDQVLDSIPKLVLVLLVAASTRSEITWIMVTVGATFAPQIAAVVNTSIKRLQASAFIEAERSLGVGIARIVLVHILWGHCRRLILAQGTSLLAYALLVESSLSYLGGELGVQEPAASWGNMIALARDGIFRSHYLPGLAPAVLISATLLGLNLVGSGILDTLEERS